MLEKRKTPRYKTVARAKIPGILEGDVLLKDLSITGCSVESTVYADIEPGGRFQMEIEPEKSAKIGNFTFFVENIWLRFSGYSVEMGFNIIASPKGKHFQRYVDYLTYRAAYE
jgi:hypothetical protein